MDFLQVSLDWRRALHARQPLGLSWPGLLAALALFPLLRLLDAVGMVKAVWAGPQAGGWGGLLVRHRSDGASKGCELYQPMP